MKDYLLILFCVFVFYSCKTDKRPDAEQQESSPSFEIHRGTNIAHWLSQSERRGEERAAFFTQKDIAFIDSVGFDHIRLPVDEEQLWDETGKRHEDAFALLTSCLTWCRDAGLRVVLDLHILRSHQFNEKEKRMWTDPKEQDKFIQLWHDLSGVTRQWPTDMLAYEFMNEPVADNAEEWNRLLSRVKDSIRSWEPDFIYLQCTNFLSDFVARNLVVSV